MLSGRLRELRETVVFVERACVLVAPGRRPAIARLLETLERCEARVVAAATPAEVDKTRAADDGMHELFATVEVPGLSADLTERVLAGIRDRYEGQHRVEITDTAIAAAVMLSGEYLPGQPLPGRAISLLDQAAAEVGRRSLGGVTDGQLADVRARKEAAIDVQDWERAASLRDREKQMLAANEDAKARAGAAVSGRNVPAHRVVAVTEEEVAAVAAGAARQRS
jgi:ATP-dependent Clp protease ATP-binding subunit ClpC